MRPAAFALPVMYSIGEKSRESFTSARKFFEKIGFFARKFWFGIRASDGAGAVFKRKPRL